MIEATARVPTPNAAEYIMSLRKHSNERMDVTFRENRGVVRFDHAIATLTPHHDLLVVTILANDHPTMERLQNVFVSTLDRVGQRDDPVKFDWHGSSYLEQRAL